MSLSDLAETLRRGDPDRFDAALAAPPAARPVLIPLYAFNLEVARAPWVASEPLIAEMRLQWWRDALAEIAEGRPVRGHEVATPLAAAIAPEDARRLDALVAARRRDVESPPFADDADLAAYLDATAGHLLWTGARVLGSATEDAVRAVAAASGLANLFLAQPDLAARNRPAFAPDEADRIAALAKAALRRRRAARPDRAARPALLSTWRAVPLLRRAAADPSRVLEGRLARSEFARRAGLLLAALRP